MKFLHYSIDDVISVFEELTLKQPDSIFDLPFFAYFQHLHNKHGLVVSCYCFFRNGRFSLANCTRSYKTEFEENSSWLRFGFHGYTGSEDYNEQSLDESARQYRDVILNLREIIGEKCLDTFPRLHAFKASSDFLRYLESNDVLSLNGLLAADDDRNSYSLSALEDEKLKCRQLFLKGNLALLRTTQRFDSLMLSKQMKLFAYSGGQIEFFTHEFLLFNQKNLKNKVKSIIIKLLIKATCKYYKKKGYIFSFPMDYINQLN